MRTAYQASPWRAATTPLARSLSFASLAPQRLGDPSDFFSKVPFIPAQPVGVPMGGRSLIPTDSRGASAPGVRGLGEMLDGVEVTREVCRCKFAQGGAELGQSCSKPTAGGSGSAEYGVGDEAHAGDSNIGTVVLAGAAGVGLLFLLGVL